MTNWVKNNSYYEACFFKLYFTLIGSRVASRCFLFEPQAVDIIRYNVEVQYSAVGHGISGGLEQTYTWLTDIHCPIFYDPIGNISPVKRGYHCRWEGCKWLVYAGSLWSFVCRVTPTVTRGLGFCVLIQKTTPSSLFNFKQWGTEYLF